ncbi:LysR family transcriptional regulator [Sphingomonas sp.]|uniref:LysR family transcriptional regulator n=1 Tax=Sphingomonas sp. TaxID=28214 RepID=UPI000DB4BF02|nr:LysR family transcriptional regulator [Sphingomonas sp.]PZU06750.1 MAG: LysR family transcriptional regulator [Sphingomonas sp.]
MSTPDWDDLRLFLAVARTGRLVGAARLLGVDHTTVARRIASLEGAIGTRLVDRTPRGTSLTAAGMALVDHAERMEAEILAASAAIGGGDALVSGTVRLVTPEVFGTHLVAPFVARLHALHPGLRLELTPEYRLVQLTNREADLAIMLKPPPRGPIVARKLADYRIGLYASRTYLANCGPVTGVDELSSHPFVWYTDEIQAYPELQFLDEVSREADPVFRSTSTAAQHAAIAGGLGLGMLHVFGAEDDDRLVRVLPQEIEIRRAYWIAMHEDQQRLPRIRAVIDFLTSMISARVLPL